jgi:hypothetical protein
LCFDLWIFTPYLYTSNTTGMNHLRLILKLEPYTFKKHKIIYFVIAHMTSIIVCPIRLHIHRIQIRLYRQCRKVSSMHFKVIYCPLTTTWIVHISLNYREFLDSLTTVSQGTSPYLADFPEFLVCLVSRNRPFWSN